MKQLLAIASLGTAACTTDFDPRVHLPENAEITNEHFVSPDAPWVIHIPEIHYSRAVTEEDKRTAKLTNDLQIATGEALLAVTDDLGLALEGFPIETKESDLPTIIQQMEEAGSKIPGALQLHLNHSAETVIIPTSSNDIEAATQALKAPSLTRQTECEGSHMTLEMAYKGLPDQTAIDCYCSIRQFHIDYYHNRVVMSPAREAAAAIAADQEVVILASGYGHVQNTFEEFQSANNTNYISIQPEGIVFGEVRARQALPNIKNYCSG